MEANRDLEHASPVVRASPSMIAEVIAVIRREPLEEDEAGGIIVETSHAGMVAPDEADSWDRGDMCVLSNPYPPFGILDRQIRFVERHEIGPVERGPAELRDIAFPDRR